ncbi:MAG: glycosyltransferase family 9 protein [Chthoniobacterales bacterium]
MNRILVIRGGAIGDFVLTLPAIKLLRDAFPQARLELLGYKHIAALAERRFYVDVVRSIEAGNLARFFAKDAELPEEWAAYFHGFDFVVSFLFDPDQIFQRNLQRCGVETFLACSPKISEGEPATVQLARPLAALDLFLTDPAPKLFPSEADRSFARASFPQEGMIALHPGSGSESKNWPVENWIALLDHLAPRSETRFLIVGGEADGLELAAFRAWSQNRVNFATNLPLPHLAAAVERCALFLGHDSGISHIAAAVGTRSMLLFGPTDPAVWAPQNPNVKVLRAPDGRMANLALADVVRLATTAI